MPRYAALFNHLATRQEGAFIPFVTLGDPTLELSRKIIDTLIAAGADALELGIPFSDPLADGPTIQRANLRALTSHTTPARCFELLADIRQQYPALPIGLLTYANLVFSNGIDRFFQQCATAGVDSVLIADVPVEESAPFHQSALQHHIAPVFICPPDADDALMAQLAKQGHGYTYLLSRVGVTGTEQRAIEPLTRQIQRLQAHHAAPAIQGFGISEPQQVQEAIASGAAGAIAGSATVKIIEQWHTQPEKMLTELTTFVRNMKAATGKVSAA